MHNPERKRSTGV